MLAICITLFFLPEKGPSGEIAAQSTSDKQGDGVVRGLVVNEKGDPLESVNIFLPQLKKGVTTNSQGRYSLKRLPQGKYTIVFSITGYKAVNKGIELGQDDTVTLNVTMKEDIIQSESITVTGTPIASDPLKTAAEISVLSGAEKVSTENASLGASLDQMAGVSNISTGAQAGKPVIRGLSGNRIRVLSDGAAMDYQQFGIRHLPNVDPVLAERIEVVRGASSVLYGSDAMGGAVNVISNKPPSHTSEGNTIRGSLGNSYAGNNEEWMGSVELEGTLGNFSWTSAVVRRTAGNLTTPGAETAAESGVSTDPKFTGELDHTNYEQTNALVGVDYQMDHFHVDASYTLWNNQQNFLLPNGNGAGQDLNNHVLQVNGLYSSVENWIFRPRFTYTRNLRQANGGGVTYENLTDSDIDVDLLNETYRSKIEAEHQYSSRLSGQLGIEHMYQTQETRGPEPLVPSAEINNIALFAFEELNYDPLRISAGLRFDYRQQEAEANAKLNLPDTEAGETADDLDNSYSAVTGSIGANYQLTPLLSLASNISSGFRAPSVFELYADGVHGGVAAYQVGRPDLDTERSLSTDLSLRYRSASADIDISIYRNAIQNYIYLSETQRSVGGQPVWEATQGDAVLIGADYQGKYQFTNWLQLRSSFEIVEGENSDTGDELPMLPATQATGEVRFLQKEISMFENAFVRFGVKYALEKEAAGTYEPFSQFDGMPFGTASTDNYLLLNAGIGFEYPVFNQKAIFNLSVDNLLDTEYRDFLDTYKGYALSQGRNVRVKLKIPFTILE